MPRTTTMIAMLALGCGEEPEWQTAPPPPALTITAEPILGDGGEVITVRNANPGAWVVVFEGHLGTGDCFPRVGVCLDLEDSSFSGSARRANANGVARIELSALLRSDTASYLHLQAVAWDGTTAQVSPLLSAPIEACLPDYDDPDDDVFDGDDTLYSTHGLSSFLNRSCPTDDDYQTISVLPGMELISTVHFSASEGDIDLELFELDGTLVDSSTSTTDNETVTYANATDDSVRVVQRVFLYSDLDTPGVEYHWVATQEELPCADSYDDYRGWASWPTPDGIVEGVVCHNDPEDWYRFNMTPGDRLFFDANWGENNVVRTIVDGQGNELVDGAGLAPVAWYSATGGAYYIRVEQRTDSGGHGLYDFDVAVVDASTCGWDAGEPNDARATAPMLPPGAYTAATCAHDVDWYQTRVRAGQTITVFVESQGERVWHQLFAASTVVLTGVPDNNGLGITTWTAEEDTVMEIRVDNTYSEETPYDLTVTVQ